MISLEEKRKIERGGRVGYMTGIFFAQKFYRFLRRKRRKKERE